MTTFILKAIGVWLAMVFCAILNGSLRDFVIAPALGKHLALPLSGITLSLVIFAITFFSMPFWGTQKRGFFYRLGGFWVILTLLFEFVFGYYVAGKTWQEIFQTFSLIDGNLFLLVILVTLLAPYLAAKKRGFIKK